MCMECGITLEDNINIACQYCEYYMAILRILHGNIASVLHVNIANILW